MVISRYPRSKFQLLKIQASLLMLSKCFIIFFTLKKKKKLKRFQCFTMEQDLLQYELL